MSAPHRVPARHRFETSELTLVAPWISPAHEGLRVAQISDVHVGPGTPAARVRRAVERINAFRPHLALLTGDYVTRSKRPVARLREQLGGIDAPTFVVLGNHDHWVGAASIRSSFESLGYTVLQNEHATVRVGRAPVVVVGVDDGHTGHDDVARALDGAPAAATRLVLAHTPVTARKLPEHGRLVCFSGHTHGGQIHVGRLTEAVLRLANQPFVRGLYEVRGNLLYVNRGLGFGRGSPLVRVGSPPEVALFTLSRRARGADMLSADA
ncbi:MAG TPA: metallophosphoesterase [Myxococcaceae bacterium]